MPDEEANETATPSADIFISRANQTHGPYPRHVIEDWIATGKINRYDLACTDKTAWQPIAQLLWPDQFAQATAGLSTSQWGWIIAAIIGVIVVGTIVSSLDSQQKSSPSTANPRSTPTNVDRLAPMSAAQTADVTSVMNLTDDLDEICKNRQKTKNAWALYTAKYTKAHDRFNEVYPSLPKNDARMMLYNMMDAYENLGSLMLANYEGKKKESPDTMLTVAGIRKALLKRILNNNVTPDMIKILESLRVQDK